MYPSMRDTKERQDYPKHKNYIYLDKLCKYLLQNLNKTLLHILSIR